MPGDNDNAAPARAALRRSIRRTSTIKVYRGGGAAAPAFSYAAPGCPPLVSDAVSGCPMVPPVQTGGDTLSCSGSGSVAVSLPLIRRTSAFASSKKRWPGSCRGTIPRTGGRLLPSMTRSLASRACPWPRHKKILKAYRRRLRSRWLAAGMRFCWRHSHLSTSRRRSRTPWKGWRRPTPPSTPVQASSAPAPAPARPKATAHETHCMP